MQQLSTALHMQAIPVKGPNGKIRLALEKQKCPEAPDALFSAPQPVSLVPHSSGTSMSALHFPLAASSQTMLILAAAVFALLCKYKNRPLCETIHDDPHWACLQPVPVIGR